MPYFLPNSLITPFCFTETMLQGIRANSNGGRLTYHIPGTGIMHISNKHSNGRMTTSISRSYHCSVRILPTRQCLKPIFCHFGVCFNASVRLSGFWVGPDVEDGWGFVEAYVHRMI